MSNVESVSIVIPTYQRESVLLETVRHLLNQETLANEIIIVDQTLDHDPSTAMCLQKWHDEGVIHWVKLPEPSVPKAMNSGLQIAHQPLVLFVDDDVIPVPDLVAIHAQTHSQRRVALVAGQVIQSWHISWTSEQRESTVFASSTRRYVNEFMGGNFSIKREIGLKLGGFDENFRWAAYRFEAEFAARLLGSGEKILYEPTASIYHLKAPTGGTRSYGNRLTTIQPGPSMGEYYFFWRTRPVHSAIGVCLGRMLRSLCTRHHLRHPWFIPLTFIAEFRGFCWSLFLHMQGPRLIQSRSEKGRSHA